MLTNEIQHLSSHASPHHSSCHYPTCSLSHAQATLPSSLLLKTPSGTHPHPQLNIHNMMEKQYVWFLVLGTLFSFVFSVSFANEQGQGVSGCSPVVKREQQKTVFANEFGQITAASVGESVNGSYLLQSFTLQPNALFLPVLLHADMVFYVHTGSGTLSWTDKDSLSSTTIKRGDIYRLQQGSVFFVQCSSKTTSFFSQPLMIHAIFPKSNTDLHEPTTGPYSSIREMVTCFDRNVLQATFQVPMEVIDELLNAPEQPAIIRGCTASKTMKRPRNMDAQFIRSAAIYNMLELNSKKKKSKLFNIFEEDKDFENCNGWSTRVTMKELSALQDTNIGVFMVNLTAGSMMTPHWNPMSTEVVVVLQGQGMVQVVCSAASSETSCKNMRFSVKEGDVFAVPKFHPVAQMSFNYDTLVFLGFSSLIEKKYEPQYLAGKASVLRTLGSDVLATVFNVPNMKFDKFLGKQKESEILACVSCAEEELKAMQQEEGSGQGEGPQGGGSEEQVPGQHGGGGGGSGEQVPGQHGGGGGGSGEQVPGQHGGGGGGSGEQVPGQHGGGGGGSGEQVPGQHGGGGGGSGEQVPGQHGGGGQEDVPEQHGGGGGPGGDRHEEQVPGQWGGGGGPGGGGSEEQVPGQWGRPGGGGSEEQVPGQWGGGPGGGGSEEQQVPEQWGEEGSGGGWSGLKRG